MRQCRLSVFVTSASHSGDFGTAPPAVKGIARIFLVTLKRLVSACLVKGYEPKQKWVKRMETFTIIAEIVIAAVGLIVAVAWVVLPFTIIKHMKEIEELMRAQGTTQRMMAQEMKVQSDLMAGGHTKV